MKTKAIQLTAITFIAALAATLFAQEAPKPDAGAAPAPAPSRKEAKQAERKAERKKAKRSAPPAATAEAAAPETPKEAADLRLNFRGVPLDMVLSYLSEAAGFTIVLETPVRGNVDVWSNQPLTKTEAVQLLSSVLNKNGYAAIQNGRTLTIVTRDEAKKRDIPVKSGNNPELIPKDDQIVTHIIPVRYINAVQVQRDLAPLLPGSATIAANESGNSLIITDTQQNIRRIAEIISALDNAVSGVATIKVFALKFADAKTLATTVKELFAQNAAGRSSDPRSQVASFIASRFGGGGPGGPGGPGGFPGGGGDRSRGGGSSGRAATAQVTAVADELSNSLIVSAPDEMIESVARLIDEIDQPVTDVTEIKVLHLKNSDPMEMAELLAQLFPDPSKTDERSTGTRFGGGFPGGPGFPGIPGGDRNRSSTSTSNQSERAKKQSRVVAVPDARTSTLIVTASKDLMPEIVAMVDQLDSSPARKQKVFVYPLENANVQEVETVLRNLFETQNTRGTQNTQSRNALEQRANNANQSQGLQQQGGLGQGGLGQGGVGGQGGFR